MPDSIEWEGAQGFIEREFEYTSQRMRDLFGLPPDFTRDDVGPVFAVLRRGAGVDRIAWASARNQRDDLAYLKEHDLSTLTPNESVKEFNDWRSEIRQAQRLLEVYTGYRFQFFPLLGESLIVARLYWQGKLGDITLTGFNTTAIGRNGTYVRELAVDVLRGDELLATVDGNRTAEPIHIHLTGIEDFDNPWNYLRPPRLVEVISDSLQVAQDPSFLETSGKFARRE